MVENAAKPMISSLLSPTNRDSPMETKQKYLNRANGAAYVRDVRGLPCAPNTLEKLASTGGGPTFYKFGGRAFYLQTDLDAWVDAKLSKREQVAL